MSDEQMKTQQSAGPAAPTSSGVLGMTRYDDLMRIYAKYSEPLQVMEQVQKQQEHASFAATTILAGVSK
jgi:hypothetical protein